MTAFAPPTSLRRANPANSPLAALREARLPGPVALYLFCVVIPIGFNAGPLAMTTLRLMLIILVVPLMIQILSGKHGRILLPDILFAAHIMWSGVALAVNNPDQVIQQIGSVGVEFLGGYVVGRVYIRTPEAFTALCRWLIAIILVSLPFAILETFTGRPIIIEIIRAVPATWTVSDIANPPRLGFERVQVMTAHPIHYGLFCSVAMSLAFVGLRGVTSDSWRYISSILVGFCGFLALSSGALLAIILQIGFFIWAAMFAKVRSRWWLLLAFLIFCYVFIDIFSNRKPIQVILHYGTFSAHNASWRILIFDWGMVNIRANPIFGIGMNDWVRPDWMHSSSVDNFWLLIAMRYGIPGFMLLALGYLVAYFQIVFRNFSSDQTVNQLRLAWTFTFAGITFTISTVHIWTNIYSFVFFFFGAGMWFIQYQARERTHNADTQTGTPISQELQFSRFPDSPTTPPSTTPTEDAVSQDQHAVRVESRFSRSH